MAVRRASSNVIAQRHKCARGDGAGVCRCAEEMCPVATTAVRVRILLAFVQLLDLLVRGDAIRHQVEVKEEQHGDESPRDECVEDDEYICGVREHNVHKSTQTGEPTGDQSQSEVSGCEAHHPHNVQERHSHEPQEVAVISLANTVTDPRAVMIESVHAVVTYATVHCTWRSVNVARV